MESENTIMFLSHSYWMKKLSSHSHPSPYLPVSMIL